jgi:hypothetical protein
LEEPSVAKSVLEVPSIAKSVLEVHSIAKSVLEVPSIAKSVLEVPCIAKSVLEVPSIAKSVLEVHSIAEIVGPGLTFAYCAACNNRHDDGDNRNRLQEATYSHNLHSGAGIQIKEIKGNCYRSQRRRKYIFI